MRGTGTDDYVWIDANGKGLLNGKTEIFNINKPRKSIRLADFDGDGKVQSSLPKPGTSMLTLATSAMSWPSAKVTVPQSCGTTATTKTPRSSSSSRSASSPMAQSARRAQALACTT